MVKEHPYTRKLRSLVERLGKPQSKNNFRGIAWQVRHKLQRICRVAINLFQKRLSGSATHYQWQSWLNWLNNEVKPVEQVLRKGMRSLFAHLFSAVGLLRTTLQARYLAAKPTANARGATNITECAKKGGYFVGPQHTGWFQESLVP